MSNPTLRFKSAYGLNFPDTVSCTLSDISKYSKGTIERKNCLFIGNEQLVSNFGGAILEFRTEAKGTEFNSGDILFGNIRPYLKKVWLSDQSGIASPDVLIFKVTDSIPGYLKCILSSERFFNHVAQGYKGSKMPRGDKHQIMDFRIQCPCLEEQQKIASFFSTLDQRIELNERKLEALEKLKKGLMQKIFSQRIRFRSDNDQSFPAWKTVKLSEISQPLTYGLNSPAKPFDGENKYLRITDIDERTNKYIQDAPVSPSAKPDNKYSLEEGDIVFARTGNSVGKTYIYQKGDGKLYYAGFLIRARINTGTCPYFIFIQTLTETYKNWVRVTSQRSGQPGINAEEYGNYVLAMPSLEEQTKIASLFIHFDKKIELVLAKINSLKKLKQGFMQQMFV